MSGLFSNPFEKRPWMYTKPQGENHSKTWFNEWQRYFLDYCHANRIHLIHRMDLRQLEPFNRLPDSSFDALIDSLLEQKYLVNWGKNSLRVYWRSNYSWSEDLYMAAKKNKRDILYGLETLRDLDPGMLEIPKQDIQQIYQILVDNCKARWIDKDNMILKIL